MIGPKNDNWCLKLSYLTISFVPTDFPPTYKNNLTPFQKLILLYCKGHHVRLNLFHFCFIFQTIALWALNDQQYQTRQDYTSWPTQIDKCYPSMQKDERPRLVCIAFLLDYCYLCSLRNVHV